MHFGHPKINTTFKKSNFLNFWLFLGFLYISHTPQKAILGSFLAFNFQNPCRKIPRCGQKIIKKFLFFKNVPKSPRKNFGHPKPITNRWNPYILKFHEKLLNTDPNGVPTQLFFSYIYMKSLAELRMSDGRP